MMLVVLPFYELLEFGVFSGLISASSENFVFLMTLLFGLTFKTLFLWILPAFTFWFKLG
jgi:hypothetical protein